MELIADYNATQIAVAVAATFASAIVRGLAGFGLAILLVPVLALALSPVEAVLIVHVLALLIGLSEIRMFLRDAEKSAWIIGGLVVLATAPGLLALEATPPNVARLLIALVALSAFAIVLTPTAEGDAPKPLLTGAVGLSSGFLTGFAGMPGPPVVPYYVKRGASRRVAKASMLLIFSIAAVAALGSGIVMGVMEWKLLALGVMLTPAVFVGNWVGVRASGRISDPMWRGFVSVVLGAAALGALWKLF